MVRPITNIFPFIVTIINLLWFAAPNQVSGTLSVDDDTINQITSYTIQITRYLNPITGAFINPVVPAEIGSTIELIFPNDYITISSLSQPGCINKQTGATLKCVVSEAKKMITISEYYKDSSTTSDSQIEIQISNIKNPIKAKQTSNFVFNIRLLNTDILDSSPSPTNPGFTLTLTFSHAAFSSCAISANNNYISTRSRFTFSITPKNAIPSEGKIVIDIPLRWQGDIQNQNTVSSTPTCTGVQGISGILTCSYTIFSSPINIARITISSLSTSGLIDQFSIDISSILTPPFINAIQAIEISSRWSDDTQIDSCSTSVHDTVPIPFKSITFTSIDSTSVQSNFNGRLQLILKEPFYYQDEIVLQVPQIFIKNGQITIASTNFAIFTTSVDERTVTLSNFPSSPSTLSANSIITLSFVDIKNPDSTQPIVVIAYFKRQNEKYQSSQIAYAAQAATSLTIQIESDNQAVNSIDYTVLKLIDSNIYIPKDSVFEMQYHSTVKVSSSAEKSVVAASLGGTLVSGVTYTVTSNVMTIANLFSGGKVDANKRISIQIDDFVNPPTVQPTLYNFRISSSSGFDIVSGALTYTANLETLISNSISSSSMKVMETSVIYSVSFTTNYGFKSVTITIPPEITITAGYETTCSPNTFTSCTLDGNKLTFTGAMQAGAHTLNWGNNVNPNSFKPTSSFSIHTYVSGYGVQKSSGYITLTMDEEATLVSKQIKPNSFTNNEETNIQIDFSVPSNSPSGRISITIPSQIDIGSSTCSVITGETCSIIPPLVTIQFDNPTPVPGLSPLRKILTLSKALNAPSNKPIPDFILKLQSVDSYKSLAASISAWSNLYTSSFETTVTSTDAYRLEQTLFTFSLSKLSGKQKYVNIQINQLFGDLTTTPTGATLISSHEIRYDIDGEGSIQKSFILVTPKFTGDFTFSLKTYTADDYLIGSSTSNVWRHTCYGTQCRACFSNNQCINCYSKQISVYYIYSTDTKQCKRDCVSGSFLSGTDCTPCSSNCLQCQQSETQCTKCHDNFFLDTVFKKCVQTCSDKFYPNTLNGQCTACVSPCLTCTSQSLCLTCRQNFYLHNTECLENCPADVMVKYDPDRTCIPCKQSCLTCSQFDYQCTSCDNSKDLYLDIDKCVKECSENRFIKEGKCSPCQLPCKVCHNSTTTCKTCYADQNLNLWYNYGCISASECAIGHFVHSVNLSCDACPKQCEKCTSLINCQACASGYLLFSNKCQVSCPSTTFVNEEQRTCDPCTNCKTCTIQNICLTCSTDQYLYTGKCFTICPSETFPDTSKQANSIQQRICTLCPQQCPTCLNSNFCKSCVSGLLLFSGKCNTACPDGSYQVSDSLCEGCPTTCLTCTSFSNCLKCKPQFSLEQSVCVVQCSKGISINQVCYPCGQHCQTCRDITCQLCEPDHYLLNGVCLSTCSPSTLTLDGQTCVDCTEKFANCTTCVQQECLSCSDGQLTEGQCFPCSQGKYSRNNFCVSCPSACTICQNATYCDECKKGFYIENDFCTDTCPDNKVPNGTKCDFCIENCAICDIATSLCHICNAGLYRYQGSCFENCPSGYVVNLNRTVCITEQDFSQEYSTQAKIIYFPFTIGTAIIVIIGIILKCYMNIMHLPTFLVSLISWVQLGSWVLFGLIEFLFYLNFQVESFKGFLCAAVGVGTLIITNFVFLRLYYKYFVDDMDFVKWEKSHCCINTVFIVLATAFNFKIHRMIYCKLLDRQQFSMVLSSTKKLIPISILSFVSLFVSSVPIITGNGLALYFSLNLDQQFFAALDSIIVTGIMLILILIDLRHPANYFIDQMETQNIKNKIYQEDDEKFEHDLFQNGNSDSEKNDGNLSKHNLLVGERQNENDYDFQKTAKRKIRRGINSNRGNKTLREGQSLGNNDISEIQFEIQNERELDDPDSENQQPVDQKPKWIRKDFDHHGYLIKYDEDNNPIKYDQNGHRVHIDENGVHHKYDENGYEVKEDEHGNLIYYDKDGWIVDKQKGQRYDSRGYLIKKNEQTGEIQFYDDHGYQVVIDEQTNEQVKLDGDGYIVKIDKQTNQYLLYDKQGHRIIKKQDGIIEYYNEDNQRLRKNENGDWQCFDPSDSFILKKNSETGEYEKYDEYGHRIEKDQYGNVYRYEPETGYRVVIDHNGEIKRYDKDSYLVKKDLEGKQHRYDADGYEVVIENGEKVSYDENGYRVQRDFYGNPTFYDQNGNIVIIDKQTGKHRKFNPEGLQVIEDENGKWLKDKRGRKVVETQDGLYEKFDEQGNRIWLDEQGYEIQTDQNGIIHKFDKIGDEVDDDSEDEEFGLVEGEGLEQNALAQEKKKRERKKFKIAKQFDYQEQYKKMLDKENPGLLYEDQGSEAEESLKEFHDFQPPIERQLQKQYNTLYEQQMGHEMERNFSGASLTLENLKDIGDAPWTNLKEKEKKDIRKVTEDENAENKMTIDPEQNLEKFQAKSVADVSISQRSFQNEGVIPISQRNSNQQDDDLDSVEQINTGRFKKKMINKRSHASFAEDDKIQTKSENNFMKGDNIPVTIQKSPSGNKSNENKIYDSDEEIESLGQQEWQNESNPNIFYKQKEFSNANTNVNERGIQFDDQEDILSDYIPQQSIDVDHKASQENLLKKKQFMQSIEEVEDQLFDKLKDRDQDNKVKRSQFKLSGTPNPLVEYAKTIEAQKIADRQKGTARYNQYSRR